MEFVGQTLQSVSNTVIENTFFISTTKAVGFTRPLFLHYRIYYDVLVLFFCSGLSKMSFFQNYFSSSIQLKKSHFYVWFLGAKESEGLRGSEFVTPAVRQLVKEANRHPPNKLTVQISGKGVKIIQTLPTISKSGKVKMEVMKLMIPSHSLTYSTVGQPPNSDVVGCIMLIFNPETRCPIHVHAYRCDSPETATIMNNALQSLINRPENQRRFADVENRLILRGLLYPR